jgi:hypothetical protein
MSKLSRETFCPLFPDRTNAADLSLMLTATTGRRPEHSTPCSVIELAKSTGLLTIWLRPISTVSPFLAPDIASLIEL